MNDKPDTGGRPEPAQADGKWPDPSQPLETLEAESKRLGEKIAEAKRRHDMPLNSSLGDPNWDEKAKDGRFDRPEDDESE